MWLLLCIYNMCTDNNWWFVQTINVFAPTGGVFSILNWIWLQWPPNCLHRVTDRQWIRLLLRSGRRKPVIERCITLSSRLRHGVTAMFMTIVSTSCYWTVKITATRQHNFTSLATFYWSSITRRIADGKLISISDDLFCNARAAIFDTIIAIVHCINILILYTRKVRL